MLASTDTPLIAGRYALEREIGRGGNGVVWLARDQRLDCLVALKHMHPQGDDPVEIRKRFLREARLAAAVSHRNVVRVTDFGVDRGDAFMVMEHVAGMSLYEWLQRSGPMEPALALDLIAQLLDGLDALHAAGIIHRDLKPENVMLAMTPDGVVPKLLDFGVAKVVDKRTGRESAMSTRRGFAFGTPHYMAPEQARGSEDLDPRCDVYGAGVLLYEMLTGEVPFDAEHPGDLLIEIIAGKPVRLEERRPELAPGVVELVHTAIAYQPRHRFSDAAAMAEHARATDPDRAPREPRRRVTLWATAALALLGLAGMDTVGAAFEAVRAERPTPPIVVLEAGTPVLVPPVDAPPILAATPGPAAELPAAEVLPAVDEPPPAQRSTRTRRTREPELGTPAVPLAFRTLDY